MMTDQYTSLAFYSRLTGNLLVAGEPDGDDLLRDGQTGEGQTGEGRVSKDRASKNKPGENQPIKNNLGKGQW